MRTFYFIVALVLVTSASTVFSQSVPPPTFPLDFEHTSTLRSPPSSFLKLGSLVLRLDETTLGDVSRRIGVGRIAQEGDAGESEYWLCYRTGHASKQETLWLLSSGEFGGDAHVIYGVAAVRTSNNSTTDACPELPKAFQPVTLDAGVWLGATPDQIRRKFGKPSLERDSWVHYWSKRKLLGDPRAKDFGADAFYDYGSLSLHIRSGHVIELLATKSADE